MLAAARAPPRRGVGAGQGARRPAAALVELVCKRMFDDADRYEVGDARRRAILQHRLDIKRSYINARPHYATTIHKSQGSTWEQVVVLSDILRNRKARERNQLLYVAYSRASRALHVRAA